MFYKSRTVQRSASLGIRDAVASDVPRDKAVATQPVHGLARQRGHPLFLCVRPTIMQARKLSK